MERTFIKHQNMAKKRMTQHGMHLDGKDMDRTWPTSVRRLCLRLRAQVAAPAGHGRIPARSGAKWRTTRRRLAWPQGGLAEFLALRLPGLQGGARRGSLARRSQPCRMSESWAFAPVGTSEELVHGTRSPSEKETQPLGDSTGCRTAQDGFYEGRARMRVFG